MSIDAVIPNLPPLLDHVLVNARYLSTPAARKPAIIQDAAHLAGGPMRWEAIFAEYQQLAAAPDP